MSRTVKHFGAVIPADVPDASRASTAKQYCVERFKLPSVIRMILALSISSGFAGGLATSVMPPKFSSIPECKRYLATLGLASQDRVAPRSASPTLNCFGFSNTYSKPPSFKQSVPCVHTGSDLSCGCPQLNMNKEETKSKR